MASARDTRTVMIVDSEPAQQRFLSALGPVERVADAVAGGDRPIDVR